MTMRQMVLGVLVAGAMVGAALPASAQQMVTVKALLSGGNEVPGVSAGAHGSAVVTVNRDAGEVTWEINVYNLPSGITMGHIHAGTAGVNGPVIIGFTIPNVGQSGAFQLKGSARASELIARPASGINSFDDAAFAIASGAAYVNLHTQANPGGEIRGQLCPTSAAANVFNGVALCTIP